MKEKTADKSGALLGFQRGEDFFLIGNKKKTLED